MPLDPEIVILLKTLNAAPANETLSVDELRANMVPVPLASRPAIGSTEDLSIDTSDGPLGLRLYKPRQVRGNGLTIFFHGGGFVIGNLETHDHLCRALCDQSGNALLAVDYRLAPEHRFPAAPDDCLAATRWAADNAAKLGIDANKLVVCGDSAGGNLATVVALRIRDEGGPALLGQLLIYPVTDFHTPPTLSYVKNATGYSLTRNAMVRFWDDYLTDASHGTHPHAAPIRASSLAGLPPALVLTAEYDPLRDEGDNYAHALLDAGVTVTLQKCQGMIHGFFRMGAASARAREIISDAARWLEKTFA